LKLAERNRCGQDHFLICHIEHFLDHRDLVCDIVMLTQ
jgi:hypothetical protein